MASGEGNSGVVSPLFLDNLVKEKRDILLHALRLGHSRRKACNLAKVNYPAFISFCNLARQATEETSPDVYSQYQIILAAEADALNTALKTVHEAIQCGDVKAAQWFLERRDRATFGKEAETQPVATQNNSVTFNLKALSLDQLRALEQMVATLDPSKGSLPPEQLAEAVKLLGPAGPNPQNVVDAEFVATPDKEPS